MDFRDELRLWFGLTLKTKGVNTNTLFISTQLLSSVEYQLFKTPLKQQYVETDWGGGGY
jgi:hypothetical protein